MRMITLYNVIDVRSNKRYSKAVVSQRNAKWFAPAEEVEGNE